MHALGPCLAHPRKSTAQQLAPHDGSHRCRLTSHLRGLACQAYWSFCQTPANELLTHPTRWEEEPIMHTTCPSPLERTRLQTGACISDSSKEWIHTLPPAAVALRQPHQPPIGKTDLRPTRQLPAIAHRSNAGHLEQVAPAHPAGGRPSTAWFPVVVGVNLSQQLAVTCSARVVGAGATSTQAFCVSRVGRQQVQGEGRSTTEGSSCMSACNFCISSGSNYSGKVVQRIEAAVRAGRRDGKVASADPWFCCAGKRPHPEAHNSPPGGTVGQCNCGTQARSSVCLPGPVLVSAPMYRYPLRCFLKK